MIVVEYVLEEKRYVLHQISCFLSTTRTTYPLFDNVYFLQQNLNKLHRVKGVWPMDSSPCD